jgi:hypothetical protein
VVFFRIAVTNKKKDIDPSTGGEKNIYLELN